MRLRFALCGLLFCSGVVAVFGAASEQVAARLRQAVRLVPVNLEMGFRFDLAGALNLQEELREPADEIARVRQELTGEPSDAPRQLRLARLYSNLGDTNAAKAALDKGLELARRRVTLQPEDGQALATLGQALAQAGKTAQAEATLREATRKGPDRWESWLKLGTLLDERAQAALAGGASATLPGWMLVLQGHLPEPVALESAQKLVDEAGACFDRAVALAPKEAEVFIARASHHLSRNTVQLAARQAKGEVRPEQLTPFSVLTTNAIPDLQAATRLAPRDYRLPMLQFWEILAQAWPPGAATAEAMDFKRMPDAAQRAAREQLSAIERIGDDADPAIAAAALTTLGGLQLSVVRDPEGARRSLRRAATLAPKRPLAWEMLIATYVQSEAWRELEPVARDWLRVRDEPRSRLVLAKALANQRQLENTEAALQEAVEKHPANLDLRLSLQAVKLMRSRTEDEAREILPAINAMGEVLKTKPDEEQRRVGPYFITTWAIAAALAGHLDEARKQLAGLLKSIPDDPYAREIEGILGQ